MKSALSVAAKSFRSVNVMKQSLTKVSGAAAPFLPAATVVPAKLASTSSFSAASFSTQPFFNAGDETGFYDEFEDTVQYPPVQARIQQPAPDFKDIACIRNGEISTISLDEFKGKYVVLFFYPKDFTYVCPTEIIAFNDSAKEFADINTQLIACSCDTAETHLAWTKTPRDKGGLGKMDIPIIADNKKTLAAKYGTLHEDDGVAFRGLFIINPEGVLQQITINNMPVGRSVNETLRLVKAFQFTDEHGEVCPANWQPGSKTIIPDATKSMEYFSSSQEQVSATGEPSLVSSVNSAKELRELVNSGKKVVMKFMAPWCGKCEQIQPFVEDLAEDYDDITFVQVNGTLPEMEEVKKEYNVQAYPSFHFFKDGKEVGNPVSGYKKSLLKKEVKAL